MPVSRFAERAVVGGADRERACAALLERVHTEGLRVVRIVWADLHGVLRSKHLEVEALADALRDGVGLVSTLLLKDTADRTALPVFDPSRATALPVGAQAGNLRLLPDPTSLQTLPWAPREAWLRGEAFTEAGEPLHLDPRRVLQRQVAALAEAGLELVCGLEVEFHVYRRCDAASGGAPALHADPSASAWPPASEAGALALCHPGFRLLSEDLGDALHPVFDTVRSVARGLGLGLMSLEVELGPSQIEAVFAPCDALTAADRLVAFRHGVRQALARTGHLATFMCQPPFAGAVASGWHLHQSLRPYGDASRSIDASGDAVGLAARRLGPIGARWLAGLLAHARGMAAFASPTLSGFSRFQGGPMSPMQAVWGLDSRGAMLRVLGGSDAPQTAEVASIGSAHIENRLGEPAANPYLYVASQIAAGLDGLHRALPAPPPSDDPYALSASSARSAPLPRSLDEALDALGADPLWADAFGSDFISLFDAVKRAEWARHQAAEDRTEWLRREYFGRF